MTDLSAPASTALLSTLAYQNLCVAEMLLAPPRQHDDVGQRAHLGRLAGDALERFSALCDAVPGGFAAARDAMDRAASPVDEFITMTTPRDGAESWLRLAAMASWEIELIERMTERDPDRLGEVARDTTGLWCRLEAAATGVLGRSEERR